MTIIDLDTVKTNLGLSDTTYDAQIEAQIPIIDAKVKQICKKNFNDQIILSVTSGVQYAEIASLYTWWGGKCTRHDKGSPLLSQIVRDIPVGTLIGGEDIPDTYVSEVFYDFSAEFSGVTYGAPFVKLADAATGTNTSSQAFYGWNKAYDSVVSKGIAWLMGQTSMAITDSTWASKAYGPVSVSKGSGDIRIDQMSGMPLWFVKALPRYM